MNIPAVGQFVFVLEAPGDMHESHVLNVFPYLDYFAGSANPEI
jgi:hypothetical protein